MKLPNRYLIAGSAVAVLVVVASSVAFASWATSHPGDVLRLQHAGGIAALSQPSQTGSPVATASVGLLQPLHPLTQPPSVAPQPSASPRYKGPPWAVFLGQSTNDPHRHVIGIVGIEGVSLASGAGAERTPLPKATTQLPLVSTSATRAYFLDGNSDVRYLMADGKSGLAGHLPGTDTVRAVFAVSPDDQQIAVSTIDYGVEPPRLSLYVESLDGSHHVDLFSSSTEYLWPIGWHAGNVVLAAGEAYPKTDNHIGDTYQYCDQNLGPCTSDNPYSATHGYRLIDPRNGARIGSLASGACAVIGLMTPVGTLCREGNPPSGLITPTSVCRVDLTFCLRQIDWSDAVTDWTTEAVTWTGVLAGDASGVAACCNVNAINLYPPRRVGGTARRLTTAALPLAFLDPTVLVCRNFGGADTHMLDLDSGHDVTINAPGVPVASLPGGY